MAVLESLGSWLPFVIVACFIIFFSFTFTLRYQKKQKRDFLVTFICSASLIIALLTACLLPTDVMLVSFMKNPNGTYKPWALNQTARDHVQQHIEIGYYVLYGLIIVMTFLVNPFFFFYYEEKEEDDRTTGKKICSAIKWTIGFLIFLIILIILGAFIPNLAPPPNNSSSSEWENINYLINHFDSSRFQDSIAFTIFSISLIGFLLLTIYTGYGSIACPIFLIRGKRSAKLQQRDIEDKRAEILLKIKTIKEKFPQQRRMPSSERLKLQELEQEEIALNRNEESIRVVRRSICFKFRHIYRPLQIVCGVLLLLFALLLFLSLLFSNINKCIHFQGFQFVFAQGNRTLPDLVDVILTWTGQVYPISYILLALFLTYIIFTSIFGLQQLGIWYFFIRMYRFSRGRTKPQALLLLSSLLMFIVVAINVFVYLLIPQYSIYGNQFYLQTRPHRRPSTQSCTQYVTTDLCQMTVMGRILLLFFYKVWFFAAAFFVLSWLFLIVFLASCVLKILRARESNIQEFSVNRLLEDDDEDTPLIQ